MARKKLNKILVSACLAGINCRYDAGNKLNQSILNLVKQRLTVTVCPEQLAGFSTPREPAEQKNGKVFNRTGEDLTDQYIQGAKKALRIAQLHGCKKAILKEKSPMCGVNKIYDGIFNDRITKGSGILTQLLRKNGIKVKGI